MESPRNVLNLIQFVNMIQRMECVVTDLQTLIHCLVIPALIVTMILRIACGLSRIVSMTEKKKTCQEGTNTDKVLCAGLGVSTTIGEPVSGDVTFNCDDVVVNVNFQLPANGFQCVTAPAGHIDCNRGDNVDADKPYTCSKALNGATPFVSIKKVLGQNACTII